MEENGVLIFDELIYVVYNDKMDDFWFVKFMVVIEVVMIFLINYLDEVWNVFIEVYLNLNDELNKCVWVDMLFCFVKCFVVLDEGWY